MFVRRAFILKTAVGIRNLPGRVGDTSWTDAHSHNRVEPVAPNIMATNASTQPGSKRWTYFHSALQLAIQRSAHKWS